MTTSNDVKQFYETFDFEKVITNTPKLVQAFLDGEIEFIKEHVKPGREVLEVGSGYGRILEILSATAKKAVGIDFSEFLLERSKKTLANKKNVELHLMNAENMSFEDESFDYVLCICQSLGNMPNIELDVVKEMARVCKKGGGVIVSVCSENAKDAQYENYTRIGLKNLRDDGKAWHADGGWYSRRFTKEDLTELFAKAGLKCEIIKICPINYIAYATKQ